MSFGEKLKTLEKLAELGGEDRVMDQTITKLLDYATERHRTDLEDVEARRQSVWLPFGCRSSRFLRLESCLRLGFPGAP